uniref:CNH domain-containing protein n=1 Tax=Heterorhabditis bacteriophora TaxID=37862 RepID=A0A1I7W6X0_HETBA
MNIHCETITSQVDPVLTLQSLEGDNNMLCLPITLGLADICAVVGNSGVALFRGYSIYHDGLVGSVRNLCPKNENYSIELITIVRPREIVLVG